jgi:hypothetical protein
MTIKINIEVTGETEQELHRSLLSLAGFLGGTVDKPAASASAGNGAARATRTPEPEPEPEPDLLGAAEEAEAEAEAEAAEAAAAAAEAARKKAAARKPAAKKYTLDDVRAALESHIDKFKQKRTSALVKEMTGVGRISEIEPKFYAPLIAEIQAQLAG